MNTPNPYDLAGMKKYVGESKGLLTPAQERQLAERQDKERAIAESLIERAADPQEREREWLLSDESEKWARMFHETYETIAPSLGYETRPESRKPWSEIPVVQYQLMVATCTKVLAAYHAHVLDEAIEKAKRLADNAYCDSLAQYRRDDCLGWEQKVKEGKFGKREMDAHQKAAEFMGAHRGIHDVLSVLRDMKEKP